MKLGKTKQQKEKSPREDTRVRDLLVYTLRTPIKTLSRKPSQNRGHGAALCMLPQSLWVHVSFVHVDLESFVLLWSSIPSVTFIISASSFTGASELWGEVFFFLFLLIIFFIYILNVMPFPGFLSAALLYHPPLLYFYENAHPLPTYPLPPKPP